MEMEALATRSAAEMGVSPHTDEKRVRLSAALEILQVRKDMDESDEREHTVNEEPEPQASYWDPQLLTDGLPADEVAKGDEREMKLMEELQLYKWTPVDEVPPGTKLLDTTWTRRWKGDAVRSRCVLRDYALERRDDLYAPTPSLVAVRAVLLWASWHDLGVETGDLVCVHAGRQFAAKVRHSTCRSAGLWLCMGIPRSYQWNARVCERLHELPGGCVSGTHAVYERNFGTNPLHSRRRNEGSGSYR